MGKFHITTPAFSIHILLFTIINGSPKFKFPENEKGTAIKYKVKVFIHN